MTQQSHSKKNENAFPHKDLLTNVHQQHCSIQPKSEKNPKCLPTSEWINKLWYTIRHQHPSPQKKLKELQEKCNNLDESQNHSELK